MFKLYISLFIQHRLLLKEFFVCTDPTATSMQPAINYQGNFLEFFACMHFTFPHIESSIS